MTHGLLKRLWQALTVLAGFGLLAVAVPASAINYGNGAYGACQYGSCSITIGSSSTVSVNVTPAASGSCTIQKDIVTVQTDNSAGYTLTVANSSTNTSLVNGGNSIAASASNQTSPAALTTNKWGYRVDGTAGFGSGPTTAQTNIGLNATTFAGVPASNATAATLASTSSKANPAVTTNVWYGVCANTSVQSGTYTTQVTYTAVTN